MGAASRSGLVLGLLALASLLFASGAARAETRVLKFYNLHTHERAEIAYKRNGRYLPEGLKKVNHILRDWRKNEPTKMNPRLLDLVWQVYRVSGSRDYINIVSGYRSPTTNKMLRSRSSGVAKQSQHTLGNALDFYLPDVPLSKLRKLGLKLEDGGVGYYPKSGSPFVHMDVGNVRHWPRMNRSELLALFPNGKTMHIPSDGKPLPGYNVALASYKSRVRGGTIMTADASTETSSKRGLLATIFGSGADEEEDRSGVNEVPASRPAQSRTTTAVAAAPQVAAPVETARRADEPSTILAALPARDVPLPRVAPRPDTNVGAQPVTIAALAAPASLATRADDAAGEAVNAKLAAFNVPLPTWRPAYSPPATINDKAVVLADVSAKANPAQAGDAIAEILRTNPRPEAVPTTTAYLPTPGARPNYDRATITPAAQTAALSSAAEKFARTLASANAAAPAVIRSSTGSPRLAMLSDPSGKPNRDLFAGVKTTEKAARVRPTDEKDDPRPVVVPIGADNARWALRAETVVASVGRSQRRQFDANLVQTPRTVYTAGFRKEAETADARRFTGNAVKFMSVARFAGN